MKRGFRVVLIFGVIALFGAVLCACGETQSESPLKLTYKSVQKYSKKKPNVKASYSVEKEALNLDFYAGCDVEKVFSYLSKNIKNQPIGTIVFRTRYTPSEDELDRINKCIGKLQPKSIKVFGLEDTLIESKNHSWTKILPKTEVFYAKFISGLFEYKDESKKDLASVKKLWLYGETYAGLSCLPNVEDLGIYATVENDDKRTSTDEKTYSSFSFETESTSQASTDKNGKKIKVNKVQPVFQFKSSFGDINGYNGLANAKNLKRITIAPLFEKYDFDVEGALNIFAMSNVRNDLLINEPSKKLSEDSYININDLNKKNKNLITYRAKSIVHEFLSDEVKGVYNKAKKFKKKNKKVKIKGKSLVYKVDSNMGDFRKKRVYHSTGRVVDEDDLGTSFKLPERAGDYKYFVYAYPTYKYYGKYDKGTKAYTETFWVQVFDLDNKIAYKPIKVGSQKPEQKFGYSGKVPDKHSGTVSIKKIFKVIKNLD